MLERINDDVRQRPLIAHFSRLLFSIITQIEMMSTPNFFLIFQQRQWRRQQWQNVKIIFLFLFCIQAAIKAMVSEWGGGGKKKKSNAKSHLPCNINFVKLHEANFLHHHHLVLSLSLSLTQLSNQIICSQQFFSLSLTADKNENWI